MRAPSRVAADMAAITARFHASRVVFGAEVVHASAVVRDAEFPDAGGSVLRRFTVARVPAASLATVALGDSLTLDGVTFRVHDVRLIAGDALRELWLARG